MGSISDIQSMLEADLEALSERGSGIRECFEAVGKATKHLGIQSGADQEIQTFLNTAVLVSTYNAFVSLNEGEPGKASWLVVRAWQEAVRATRDHPVSALYARKSLNYHLAVSDFLDAEVRFSQG
jgi:hypothetical protein